MAGRSEISPGVVAEEEHADEMNPASQRCYWKYTNVRRIMVKHLAPASPHTDGDTTTLNHCSFDSNKNLTK